MMETSYIVIWLLLLFTLTACPNKKGASNVSDIEPKQKEIIGTIGLGYNELLQSHFILSKNKDQYWNKKYVLAKIRDSCIVSVKGKRKHLELISSDSDIGIFKYEFSDESFLVEVKYTVCDDDVKSKYFDILTGMMVLKSTRELAIYDSIKVYGIIKK